MSDGHGSDDESTKSSVTTAVNTAVEPNDSLLLFFIQTTPALLLAGCNTLFSGWLYDRAEASPFYDRIHEAFILTPPILGLKGNIEMTLVSRLSTFSHHTGFNKSWWEWLKSLAINLTLIWTQSFVLTLFASVITLIMLVYRAHKDVDIYSYCIMLLSTAITATTLASALLGTLMCFLVWLSVQINVDPDNVATPLSASTSDVVTLALFIYIGESQLKITETPVYLVNLMPIVINILIVPFFAYVSYVHEDTRPTLISGWGILILAVMLNGVPKLFNLSSITFWAVWKQSFNNVQSTQHQVQYDRWRATEADSESFGRLCSPVTVYGCQDADSKCGVLLIVCSVPLQVVFAVVLCLIYQDGSTNFSLISVLVVSSLAQVTFLIFLSHCLVALVARFNMDPDNCSIPVITSFADLTGAGLLYLVFLIAGKLCPYALKHDH
ncbi:unnamed protein product [Bursaphelenchus okinawaensis]|uniref:SLC41A/MgtE integral membrane domain-containing protein n=1 Tax=Bursaphelenchus okinawaensis TaxID=465554 RepID=A0A811L6Y7_9BILA|nr:unnamed protein product [Bursaphelenchus okinawaensis]CAG9116982.1 unnamed protein product [Bursaphelenchus okinawaensis]